MGPRERLMRDTAEAMRRDAPRRPVTPEDVTARWRIPAGFRAASSATASAPSAWPHRRPINGEEPGPFASVTPDPESGRPGSCEITLLARQQLEGTTPSPSRRSGVYRRVSDQASEAAGEPWRPTDYRIPWPFPPETDDPEDPADGIWSGLGFSGNGALVRGGGRRLPVAGVGSDDVDGIDPTDRLFDPFTLTFLDRMAGCCDGAVAAAQARADYVCGLPYPNCRGGRVTRCSARGGGYCQCWYTCNRRDYAPCAEERSADTIECANELLSAMSTDPHCRGMITTLTSVTAVGTRLANGSVDNRSNLPVYIWFTGAPGPVILPARTSTEDLVPGGDIDHVRDHEGAWYKIGPRAAVVHRNGEVTNYRCRISDDIQWQCGADCKWYDSPF